MQTVLHRLLTMITITSKALSRNYLNIRRFLCNELLKAMLVHSDNYAAPCTFSFCGNEPLTIHQMNEKARELGMRSTRFSDSSGLSDSNISSAMDLD